MRKAVQFTIDFAVARDCPPLSAKVAHGVREGSSDHLPVTLSLPLQGNCTRRPSVRIPTSRRSKQILQDEALRAFQYSLPEFTLRLQSAVTGVEIEEIFSELTRQLTLSFRPKSKCIPMRRAREFWRNEMQHQARKRSNIYRKSHRTRSARAWDAYLEADGDSSQALGAQNEGVITSLCEVSRMLATARRDSEYPQYCEHAQGMIRKTYAPSGPRSTHRSLRTTSERNSLPDLEMAPSPRYRFISR